MSLWIVKPAVGLDVAMFLVSLAGLAINSVLLYVTRVFRGVTQAVDTVLIQFIAVFDAVICLVMMLGIVLRRIVGESILSNNGWWCRMSAIVYSGSLLVVLVFTALLAIVRYLAIVHGLQINNLHFSILMYSILASIYILFSLLAFNCTTVVPPSGLYCTPRFSGPSLLSRIGGYITLALLAFSLVAIPVSYLGVTLHYQKMVNGFKESYSLWRLQRSIYSLIIVMICYTATTLPEFILVGLSVSNLATRTSLNDGIVILLLSTITIINPLFSLLMHNDIYRRFLNTLGITPYTTEYALT
ncbi:hypothetical protein DSO57_1026146 [Entomophthora muscae]|uniref:Uncharacterized protein n=1 Tax=Entomophthora muscae TaxID=34485 RepID=A0ACC2TDC5_9FUNG|nr:hypothetical protein DSO57_1026146 [Entomophthora muscae]